MSALNTITILKLKLRRNGPAKASQQQFDLKKLKESRTKSIFILQLKNKFQALAKAEKHTPPGTTPSTPRWSSSV